MVVQPSNSIDLPRLIDCADYIVRVASCLIAATRPGQPEKGGYLVVHEINSNSLELLIRIGPYDPVKAPTQIQYAQEKASRLYLCIRAGKNNFASYETRDPDNNLWGGAINAKTQIFSFSGLPELWDEAAMLVLAIRLGYLDEAEVLALVDEERNPHLRQLLVGTTKWQWP